MSTDNQLRGLTRRERIAFAVRKWNPFQKSNVMADAAIKGLTAKGFPTEHGWCQRWTRLVIESVFGKRFEEFMKPTAKNTSLAFEGTRYDVPKEQGSLPGDILYKEEGSGGSGHVGIRIYGNLVAENSSFYDTWGEDARGVRTLEEFGHFDRIVRLIPVKGGDK